MTSIELTKLINQQMNREFYSAYLYLKFASALEQLKLPGSAHWMEKQAKEEVLHGLQFYRFLVQQEAEVILEPINAPEEIPEDCVIKIFAAALRHEKYITRQLNDLTALAAGEHNFCAMSFLSKMLDQQVADEFSVHTISERLILSDNKRGALLFIDSELAKR